MDKAGDVLTHSSVLHSYIYLEAKNFGTCSYASASTLRRK